MIRQQIKGRSSIQELRGRQGSIDCRDIIPPSFEFLNERQSSLFGIKAQLLPLSSWRECRDNVDAPFPTDQPHRFKFKRSCHSDETVNLILT
jgi:hypothetical protein